MRLLTAALVLLGAGRAWAEAAVVGVRSSANAERTRIVLDLTTPVEFTLFTLADPYRVVLDFPKVDWRAPLYAAQQVGLVAGLRYGQFRPEVARLVLDLAAPAAVKTLRLLPPAGDHGDRLLLDLTPVDRAAFLAAMAAPQPTTEAQAVPSASARRADSRRIVVIDAGHGGVDPGTIGPSGVYEKDLVLKYALELKRRLLATKRYQVVMTRDDDVFLSLGERVRVAQESHADLFISIHADSIENSKVRGGAVYTLSETASDAEAERLAARENKSDLIAGLHLDNHDTEVVSILISLAQRETMNYSARFANLLVPEFEERDVDVRRRPHRFAGFRVLKAPDVPSVLVELGYLSNPREEKVLRSAAGRKARTTAIVAAIDRYFADLKL